MSFSGEVKEELSRYLSTGTHCLIAEIAAIVSVSGQICISENDEFQLLVQTENVSVARKYFTLLKKTFNIEADIRVRKNKYLTKTDVYRVVVRDHNDTIRILQAVNLMSDDLEVAEDLDKMYREILRLDCCRKAFLRGIFLAAGSISDPEKSYHLELVCATEERALQLQMILHGFDLEARIVNRKKNYVVYIKEGSQIISFLSVIDAGASLMRMENVRARKEISNNVNRKVNCETANINKTVSASVKQIEDINYIKSQVGFSKLSESLEKIAVLRLQYPEASLKELGEMLDPPVGKSGVNHRLRKLSEMAEELRAVKEEVL